MAIGFARARYVSRRNGGNAIRSAAYNMRGDLVSERTGERHAYEDQGTLTFHEILLPEGASERFADPAALWNAAEGAEHRKDSQLAREVVLALPADAEITVDDRIALAQSFAKENFVDKGLAVQLDIHAPHSGEPDAVNHHAHLLVTTRTLDGDDFGRLKHRDSDVRSINGRPIVTKAEQWGSVWAEHQDAYFRQNGKGISVAPVGPIPQVHIGPKRFRHPRDQRIATNNHIRDSNAKLAHDPKIREFRLDALDRASWADRTQSGLRKLTVEDVARELSPAYAKNLKEAEKLRRKANKADWILNRQDIDKERADYRVQERWDEMGVARRAAHLVGTKVKTLGALRDIELERWANESGRGDYTMKKWSIRREATKGKLDVATRQAEAELEKVRPQATSELQRRQKIALNAKHALDNMARDEKLTARTRRTHTNGRTL